MAADDALLEPIEPEADPSEQAVGAEPRRTPPAVRLVRDHPLVAGLAAVITVLLVAAAVATRVVHGPAPRDRLSAAFARTVRARSARVTVTIKAIGGAGVDEAAQETSIDGIVGFRPVRGMVTVRASAAAMAAAPLSSTMILTPDALFTRTDAAPPQFHGGRHWLRSDRGDRVPGPFTAAASGATTVRPPVGDAVAVRRVGAETIDGAPVTHYVSRLATPAPGHPAIQLDVWVDGRGRVRRIRDVTPTSGTGRFEMDVDYLDFGIAVPDRAPPASDVVDPSGRVAPSTDTA